MEPRFRDSVAVVTGGGAGIGEATCERLAEEGASVVPVDVDGEGARETAARLEAEYDARTLPLETDVGDEAAVRRAADRIAREFDTVDVLVNNAGVRVEPGPVTDVDGADLERVLAVNLKGVVYCSKHVIPLLIDDATESIDEPPRDRGAVVNVASVGATVARPGWSLYDGTKGAIVAMTRDMACDHAAQGIRVNAVSPGYVVTEYHLDDRTGEEAAAYREAETTPHDGGPGILERAARPAEVAASICYLASPDASYVTGANHAVDGGASLTGL